MKYLSLLLVVTSIFLLGACTSEDAPSSVLGKDKMVNILMQLHLAEAFVNANYPFSDSSKFVYKSMEDSVLRVQGTDVVTFDSSMAYYQRHAELLDGIYSAVVDSLSLRESVRKK